MDLNQLRTFVTVASLGNLTRASERLFLSQPAVSAQLKQLESELGVGLFTRSARGMQLTVAGEQLRAEAEAALDAAERLKARASRLRADEVAGELRLGTVSEPAILRLTDTLGRLVERHPGLVLKLAQRVSGEALEQLADGRLDAAWVMGEVDDARLASLTLGRLDLVVTAPAAWAARLDGADWDAVSALPWISLVPHCSLTATAARVFADRRSQLRPAPVQPDNEVSLRNLVAAGHGLALLRADLASAGVADGTLAIWPGLRESIALRFAYPRQGADSPRLAALIDAVRASWALPDDDRAVAA
ncbi:LysR family transcriptional regulator [Derxia gummosa]|uniref:LysR family transcriptional regulator n=1 Tax=Derxia gummosa DSM 723 TaxID=1121388 RepID=A0A8B6X6M9_9BURK|nr:LysR family transcriptional regulator [Derxia gummosa]